MKISLIFCCLCVGYAYAAPAIEPVSVQQEPQTAPVQPQPEAIETPAISPKNSGVIAPESLSPEQQTSDASSAVIKVGVDNANKLLYDLDATVNKIFDDNVASEAASGKADDISADNAESGAQAYAAAANRELDFAPRQTGSAQQPASVVTQLENLEKRLLNTINELQTRRRYFSSTMLRQMYNSVHRIRVNISRIQRQFPTNSQQANSGHQTHPTRPGVNNLQQRVSDIQKAVNDIINRVTSTFQPNAPKPPGQTPAVTV